MYLQGTEYINNVRKIHFSTYTRDSTYFSPRVLSSFTPSSIHHPSFLPSFLPRVQGVTILYLSGRKAVAIFPRFHADSGFCRRISHGSLLEPDECVLHLLARLPLAILSALANVNVTNGGQKRTSKAATWPSVTPPSSIPEIPRGMSWRFRRPFH